MAVLVDGRRVGRGGAVHRARAGRVVVGALAEVPGVVRPGPALVDLLPTVLADVVDEEARARGVRVEGEAEGVASSPEANVSWHFLPGSVRPVRLQRALSVPV